MTRQKSREALLNRADWLMDRIADMPAGAGSRGFMLDELKAISKALRYMHSPEVVANLIHEESQGQPETVVVFADAICQKVRAGHWLKGARDEDTQDIDEFVQEEKLRTVRARTLSA